MQQQEISKITETLRKGFNQKQNASLKQRLHHLGLLEKAVIQHETEIFEAMALDFSKPKFETFLTEIFPVLDEIKHFKRHLSGYMKPQKVGTPLPLLPSSGSIYHEPKGVVLIIGAWNYPITLTLVPLVGALASGNTVLLKPSEIASHTSAVIKKILSAVFSPDVLQVIEGDGEYTSKILDHGFDHVFYTGSSQVGKLVYQKAAVHLTPVTLELGGKSPSIFHQSANFKKGVKRLLWGKFLNGGQTCVAPDYALVPIEKKAEFLKYCGEVICEFFSENGENQSVIINDKHFERIVSLMEGNHKIRFGGKSDALKRYIEPTVIEIFGLDHNLMKEEIFGPVLPVYFYKYPTEIKEFYDNSPNPLALYIFSTDKKFTDKIIEDFPSGGVLINDVIMHLANVNLPFGGRGSSGFGNYHGLHSFHTFSHAKSVMKQVNWIDPAFRYPKYSEKKFRLLKKLIRFVNWI